MTSQISLSDALLCFNKQVETRLKWEHPWYVLFDAATSSRSFSQCAEDIYWCYNLYMAVFSLGQGSRSSQPKAHHSNTISQQITKNDLWPPPADLARVPLSNLLNGGIFLTGALFSECILDLLPRTFRWMRKIWCRLTVFVSLFPDVAKHSPPVYLSKLTLATALKWPSLNWYFLRRGPKRLLSPPTHIDHCNRHEHLA